jgi:hypothetical protein
METTIMEMQEILNKLEMLNVALDAHRREIAAFRVTCELELARLAELTERHEALIGGRNKSAATKRNMTDEDARAVLTGDFAHRDHKDAGEALGLTYAQVYSCRMEYTFKHVHKELRDIQWKNPWRK